MQFKYYNAEEGRVALAVGCRTEEEGAGEVYEAGQVAGNGSACPGVLRGRNGTQ